jgi:soluble lytic murein transglycosylase-like protein
MRLMQLMPGTAKLMVVKNPYDPEQNIMAGRMKYLRQMVTKFNGDMNRALMALNWGLARGDGRICQ